MTDLPTLTNGGALLLALAVISALVLCVVYVRPRLAPPCDDCSCRHRDHDAELRVIAHDKGYLGVTGSPLTTGQARAARALKAPTVGVFAWCRDCRQWCLR